MEVQDGHVPEEIYAEFLRRMPQVCIELIIEHDGAALLCRPMTEPAEGEWFWSGTRLFRGEALQDAVQRLAQNELGVAIDVQNLLGIYSHFWETSPVEAVDTQHTVTVGFLASLRDGPAVTSLDEQDDAFRFVETA
jgi:colanic acid biosynthesis protein WcaH